VSKGNTFENDLLQLIFNAVTIANIANNASSSPLASLYVSLHTADPGEAGAQNTSEATYTNYARVAVARTVVGFTVTLNAATNAAAVIFPESGGVANTITHFGVGTASSGAGKLLYKGALGASLIVNSGIQPRFEAGDLDITED
jgi:hypothetical protein